MSQIMRSFRVHPDYEHMKLEGSDVPSSAVPLWGYEAREALHTQKLCVRLLHLHISPVLAQTGQVPHR